MPTRPLILALAVLLGEPGGADWDEVGRLFAQGQEHYDRREYVLTLDCFEASLDLLPELEENKQVRESLIINILSVGREAYEQAYDDDGRRNIEFVERAVDSLDDYEAAYEAAYGEPPRGAEVTSLGRELREILDEVGSCLSIVGPCLSPLPPCLSPLPVERRGCGGKDGGVASLMLLPLALRRRRKSILEQVSSALPADVLARLRQRPDADD